MRLSCGRLLGDQCLVDAVEFLVAVDVAAWREIECVRVFERLVERNRWLAHNLHTHARFRRDDDGLRRHVA